MHRTIASQLIASIVLLHVAADCLFHHAPDAEDNCPPACACSDERVLANAAACECSHHPHDRTRGCNGSHCVFTKGEKEKDVAGDAIVAWMPIGFGLFDQSESRRQDALAFVQPASVPRQILFEVFLI